MLKKGSRKLKTLFKQQKFTDKLILYCIFNYCFLHTSKDLTLCIQIMGLWTMMNSL